MISVLVKKIVNFIAVESNIEDIYYLDRIRYGLEVFIGEGIKLIVILLISLMINRLPEFFIITILIFGVRTKLGGGHCKSFSRCFIKTLGIYLIMYFLSSIVIIPRLIRILILVAVIVTIFTAKYKTKIKEIEDPKVVLKLKLRTSFIYLSTYILVKLTNNSTYINLVLLFGTYMIYEYYMNNRGKTVMKNLREKLGLRKLMSGILTTTSIGVGEATLKSSSIFFWGEVELPLEIREKNK
jgi:accessory gene regulator B